MACSCQNKRLMYEVVLNAGTGRVAFSSSNRATAEAVQRRYTDSIVRERRKGQTADQAAIVYPPEAATAAPATETTTTDPTRH